MIQFLKDLFSESTTVSSSRVYMFMGGAFAIALTSYVAYEKMNPNDWYTLISMFFLGGGIFKLVQKFKENKPEDVKEESGGQ